jgi:peptide/nickel transport system permease protein
MRVATGAAEVQERRGAARHDSWAVPNRKARTWWADTRRRFLRQRLAVASAIVLLLFSAVALAAPVAAPYDPIEQFRKEGLTSAGQPLPPNTQFWLGTDDRGRDLLSRLIWGARVSLGIGLAASTITMVLALIIGGGSGFVGGKTDFLLMRLVDLMMSVPTFFVMLLLISMFKPSPWIVIVVIALFGWAYPGRVFRSEMLSLKQLDFVMAARCVGIPAYRIYLRHLLPHMLSLVIVYLALSIPSVIFAEASLSFLGLGIPPPAPSWGGMIADGQAYYRAAPWLVLFPGLAIMITVVCFNLLGAGLRDVMDPRQRRR